MTLTRRRSEDVYKVEKLFKERKFLRGSSKKDANEFSKDELNGEK